MEDVESGKKGRAIARWRPRRLDGRVCGSDSAAGSHPVEFR